MPSFFARQNGSGPSAIELYESSQSQCEAQQLGCGVGAVQTDVEELLDPDDPRTGWVDYGLARAMRDGFPMTDRPGSAATTRRPLLNKQHPAHPRTEQDTILDVAGPAENNQHLRGLALHDPLRVNSQPNDAGGAVDCWTFIRPAKVIRTGSADRGCSFTTRETISSAAVIASSSSGSVYDVSRGLMRSPHDG